MKKASTKKKGSEEKPITDKATLRSLAAVDELNLWAEKAKKSLARAQKSIRRAQERYAKALEQVDHLLTTDDKNPDSLKWIVTPHALAGALKTLDGVAKDVEEMVTVANRRWSKEEEQKRLLALEKEKERAAVQHKLYGDDVPF